MSANGNVIEVTGYNDSYFPGYGGSDFLGYGGSDFLGFGGSDFTGCGGSDFTGYGGSDCPGYGDNDFLGYGGSDVSEDKRAMNETNKPAATVIESKTSAATYHVRKSSVVVTTL